MSLDQHDCNQLDQYLALDYAECMSMMSCLRERDFYDFLCREMARKMIATAKKTDHVETVMNACKEGIVPFVSYLCRESPSMILGGSLFVTEDECVDVVDINAHNHQIGTKYARIYSAISCAAKYNQVGLVQVLLALDWAPNVLAYTASLAVRYEYPDVLAFVLPRLPREHPFCLLSTALSRRNAHLIRMLLESGYSANVPFRGKTSGFHASQTCLSHAIESHQDEAAELMLLHGADPAMENNAAFLAASMSNPKWVHLLSRHAVQAMVDSSRPE